MSDLKTTEAKLFEELFGMSSGYVLDFTNKTFAEFFSEHGIDIYSDKYAVNGISKAKRLRAFWKIEPNNVVAEVLSSLLDYWRAINPLSSPEEAALARKCERVVQKLRLSHPALKDVRKIFIEFNAQYLARQIRRIEQSVESDPELAIGTAKELIETCCRTILAERGKPVCGTPNITTLTKAALRELKLVPESIPEHAKGREVVKRILSNLAALVQGLVELRGLYGTGHGKEGTVQLLKPRHAKLATSAAITLVTFLFETHKERRERL